MPGKHMSVRQEIFVTQLGRKFRLFLSTVQRYENFKALPNYIAQKARKKTRSDFNSKKITKI
jgi:hypothetical protein